MARTLAGVLVAGGLCFPFLILMARFDLTATWNLDEILWAFGNSFNQAALSATVTVLLGIWGGRGLLSFSGTRASMARSWLELLLLLPNFLPALFTLLVLLNLLEPYPTGVIGIALAHVALNWGLASVLAAALIERKLGGLAEVAWVEGWSRRRFWWRGAVPLLAKDFGLMWAFFFALCFASFSIPLVVGGVRGTTLEVLIYEKIRLSTDWGMAVNLAILQSAVLFLIGWLAMRGRASGPSRPANLRFLRSSWGLGAVVLFSMAWIFGYAQGLVSGLPQVGMLGELVTDLGRALAGSLAIALLTGFLCLLGLAGLAWIWPSAWFEKFLSGYVAPSQALAGFAFLIVTPNEGWWPYLKIPLVLTLLFLTSLWRMGWQSELDSLRGQRDVALTLGASESLIRRRVIWPQASARAGTLAGIAAVWAAGDFALSRILAYRDLTLAMMTESLMSGYRLGLATVLSLGVIGVAVLAFVIMKGVAGVAGRESRS